jgi:hypothetical protein
MVFGQEKITSELNLNYSLIHYNDTIGHVRRFDFKISAPIYQNGKSRLSSNFSYNSESLNDFPPAYGTSLQGLGFGLNWTDIINPRSALIIFGQGGIYSDMTSLSSNAIRERLGFTWLTKHSDRLSLGFGVSYTRQFYGNQIIPIIAVIYHFDNEHWKLSGAFPESPKLSYNLSNKSALSLQLKAQFASYRLNGARDSGTFVKTSNLTSMLSYEYNLAKSWRISTGIGYAMRQRYELYKDDNNSDQWYFIGKPLGEKPTPITSIVQNGLQLHIGLAFNPTF